MKEQLRKKIEEKIVNQQMLKSELGYDVSALLNIDAACSALWTMFRHAYALLDTQYAHFNRNRDKVVECAIVCLIEIHRIYLGNLPESIKRKHFARHEFDEQDNQFIEDCVYEALRQAIPMIGINVTFKGEDGLYHEDGAACIRNCLIIYLWAEFESRLIKERLAIKPYENELEELIDKWILNTEKWINPNWKDFALDKNYQKEATLDLMYKECMHNELWNHNESQLESCVFMLHNRLKYFSLESKDDWWRLVETIFGKQHVEEEPDEPHVVETGKLWKKTDAEYSIWKAYDGEYGYEYYNYSETSNKSKAIELLREYVNNGEDMVYGVLSLKDGELEGRDISDFLACNVGAIGTIVFTIAKINGQIVENFVNVSSIERD